MTVRLSHQKGDTIGRNQYRILERIKSGGMGTVYRAVNCLTNTMYAVKECDVLDDPRGRQLGREQAVSIFMTEAAGLEQLSHVGIPRGFLLDDPCEGMAVCLKCGNKVSEATCGLCCSPPDGMYYQPQPVPHRYYLFMEFIEGQDVHEAASVFNKPLNQADGATVVGWFREVVDVVTYLHRNHLAHCDIKPENLRIRAVDGRLFLLDFGLLRLDSGNRNTRLLNNGRTLKLGTEGFAAPEQARGNPGDASDIFALAMSFLNLVTGLDPSNPVQLQALRGKAADLVPGLDPTFARLLDNCRLTRVEDRPCIDQWCQILNEGAAMISDRVDPKPAPPAPSRRKFLALGGVLVTVLALLIFVPRMASGGSDRMTAIARTSAVIYKGTDMQHILKQLSGGEKLMVVDSGSGDGYLLKILRINDRSSKGYIKRSQVDITGERERR